MTPLWDFGWFDVSRFQVEATPAECSSVSSVIEAFIASPTYERSFCTRPDPWGAAVGRHGPYLPSSLKVQWFQSVPPQDIDQRIRAVLANPSFSPEPSPEQVRPIQTWLAEVATRGDAVFVLEPPADNATRVDWAWVWLLFHEFVTVSPRGDEIAIAIIGYD